MIIKSVKSEKRPIVCTTNHLKLLEKQASEFDDLPMPDMPTDTSDINGETVSTETDVRSIFLPTVALQSKQALEDAVFALPSGSTAVSVMLYTAQDGALFKASSASLLSIPARENAPTASDISRTFKSYGLYSSVIIESRALALGLDPAERAAVAAYEQLLISELYTAGCNEFIIYNANITPDTVGSVNEYCTQLKKLCEGIKVGISLARGADVSKDGSVIYSRHNYVYDFLCLDLTAALYADINNAPTLLTYDAASADGTDAELSEADFPTLRETVEYELLHISRYDMRVLFRITDNATAEGCSAVLLPFLADLSLHSVSLVSGY
jgi:hypothetical protein